jgi:superfamily I DNA and RNA helicase
VEAGDQRAIEFALEVTGRYNKNTLAIADARTVVQLVADAVIKNTSGDAATREAILNDIRAAIVGFDMNNRKALE